MKTSLVSLRDSFQFPFQYDHGIEVGLLRRNLKRAFILAMVMTVFETLVLMGCMVFSSLPLQLVHCGMYVAIIAGNFLMLGAMSTYMDKAAYTPTLVQNMNSILWFYLTFLMCWQGVITALAPETRAHVSGYMLTILMCALLFAIPLARFMTALGISLLVFLLAIIAWGAPLAFPDITMLYIILYAGSTCIGSALHYNSVYDQEQKVQALQSLLYPAQPLVDRLTGIPTKESLESYTHKLSTPGHTPRNLNVLILGIARMKEYNQCYGQTEGDLLLIRLSRLVEGVANTHGAFCARYEEDKFILIQADRPPMAGLHMRQKLDAAVCALHQEQPHLPFAVRLGYHHGPVKDSHGILDHLQEAEFDLRATKAYAVELSLPSNHAKTASSS